MIRTPGLYEGIPNDEYHTDKEWLSSSQIKVALGSAHAYKYFVIDGKGTRKTTDAKSFGSVVHKLVLEADTFHDEYVALDLTDLDLRRKADKERYEAMIQDIGSRTVISPEDMKQAQLCYESIMKHKDARRYLELPGVSEASIYVELEHMLPSGEIVPFKVRVRPDRLAHGHAILDLKTTKNPSKDKFTRDALGPWGYHYDLSAALYVKAVQKLTGQSLPFIFIAARNDEPWETAVYKFGGDSSIQGQAKLNRAINTIILSERAGTWEYQSEMEEI
jgi:hypothetical protein